MLVPLKANKVKDVNTEFTIVHINARWNKKNDVNIPSVPGCSIKYAYFEDQPESLKSTIQYVPTVVLYKGNRVVYQWSADLSFKLELNRGDIEEVINRL